MSPGPGDQRKPTRSPQTSEVGTTLCDSNMALSVLACGDSPYHSSRRKCSHRTHRHSPTPDRLFSRPWCFHRFTFNWGVPHSGVTHECKLLRIKRMEFEIRESKCSKTR